MRYWVESEDLWAANETGLVWRGRPDGRPAISAVLLPGTEDAVVVLSPHDLRGPLQEIKRWPNLVRVRPDGTVVWRISADPASSEVDWWTSAGMEGDRLLAVTWCSQVCELDPASGAVLSKLLTK